MNQHQRHKRHVDVVKIVNQVRQTIEKREARIDNAGRIRERVRDRIASKFRRMYIPEDVKDDLQAAHMEWVFAPDTFWWSRRPGVGPLVNALRRVCRPFVKLFFNPDALLHYVNRLGYLVRYQQQLIEDMYVEIEFLREAAENKRRGTQRGGRSTPAAVKSKGPELQSGEQRGRTSGQRRGSYRRPRRSPGTPKKDNDPKAK